MTEQELLTLLETEYMAKILGCIEISRKSDKV